MMRCPDGKREVTPDELRAFEGLVFSTARMFASQVRREEEDLAQELRIVVWRAVTKHDPTRSKLSLERYVFGCITNKVRDYKRDAAREHDRRDRNGVSFLHIEDMKIGGDNTINGMGSHYSNRQENFDNLFNFVERDAVYGRVEGDLFELPSTVTEQEAEVLVLLMMEVTKPEIMLRLGITRARLDTCIAALRAKFADWNPASAPVVEAEAELVGSQAA